MSGWVRVPVVVELRDALCVLDDGSECGHVARVTLAGPHFIRTPVPVLERLRAVSRSAAFCALVFGELVRFWGCVVGWQSGPENRERWVQAVLRAGPKNARDLILLGRAVVLFLAQAKRREAVWVREERRGDLLEHAEAFAGHRDDRITARAVVAACAFVRYVGRHRAPGVRLHCRWNLAPAPGHGPFPAAAVEHGFDVFPRVGYVIRHALLGQF